MKSNIRRKKWEHTFSLLRKSQINMRIPGTDTLYRKIPERTDKIRVKAKFVQDNRVHDKLLNMHWLELR